MAWVLDGQQEARDLRLAEACGSSGCAALRGVDRGVLIKNCGHRTDAYYWRRSDKSGWHHCGPRLDLNYVVDCLARP